MILHDCHYLVQSTHFGSRSLDITIAAMPNFISSRKSNLPEFVAAFAFIVVVTLVGVISLVALVMAVRHSSVAERRLLTERHKQALVAASKDAHERTIAYACHQLRYY